MDCGLNAVAIACNCRAENEEPQFFSTVRADEVPPVPENKFLLRGIAPPPPTAAAAAEPDEGVVRRVEKTKILIGLE